MLDKFHLAQIKMDDEEFDLILFWFLKLRKIGSQNVKKERKIWIRKIFEEPHFFVCFFDFYQADKDIF